MKLSVALILLAMLLGGCVSVDHKPLTKDAAQQLQGKTIGRTEYKVPDFAAYSPAKAALGLLGVPAIISEGNAIIKDSEVPDPAVAIGKELVARLVTAKAVNTVESTKVLEKDDIPALISAHPGSDYLLDVKTLNWMLTYYPTNWVGYKVMYSARLRLIHAPTKTVVAESACKTVQGDDAKPPSRDQLLQNKAALMKEYLAKAATSCADVLAKDVLQL